MLQLARLPAAPSRTSRPLQRHLLAPGPPAHGLTSVAVRGSQGCVKGLPRTVRARPLHSDPLSGRCPLPTASGSRPYSRIPYGADNATVGRGFCRNKRPVRPVVPPRPTPSQEAKASRAPWTLCTYTNCSTSRRSELAHGAVSPTRPLAQRAPPSR